MPKREATSELTDRNWDQEDEQEQAGTFQKADREDIGKRVIKKAKRRGSGGNEGNTGSAFGGFKGFSGFGAKTTPAPSSSMFTSGSSKPNGGDGKSVGSASFSFAPKPQTCEPTTFKASGSSTVAVTSTKSASNGNHSADYSTQLQSLNKCVLEWIQKHIDKNPVCDLSPIFDDYRKHLSNIEKNSKENKSSEVPKSESTVTSQMTTTTTAPAPSQKSFSGFSFKTSTSESKPSSSGLQFGSSKETNASGLFGNSASSQPATSGFSFGPAKTETKPFGFGGAVAKDEDEYEPPKVEVKEIKEKDSLFTIRCKFFYKAGDDYKDRGVGNLHLKKTAAVAQLLIRADTNLGNIILNVGLPPNLPVQRRKNNVMMIIPPNPPISDKCPQCNKKYANPQGSNVCESGCAAQPVAVIFRVKTAEDADKLLEEIKNIMK